MKNFLPLLVLISGLLPATFAFGDIQLLSGESILSGGQRVTCDEHSNFPTTNCFCADSGCSTGFTSAGNVILNIETTNSSGSTQTRCVEYSTESQCLQAMSACN